MKNVAKKRVLILRKKVTGSQHCHLTTLRSFSKALLFRLRDSSLPWSNENTVVVGRKGKEPTVISGRVGNISTVFTLFWVNCVRFWRLCLVDSQCIIYLIKMNEQKGEWSPSLLNSDNIILEQDYQPELGNFDLLLASLHFLNPCNHHHHKCWYLLVSCKATPPSLCVHLHLRGLS